MQGTHCFGEAYNEDSFKRMRNYLNDTWKSFAKYLTKENFPYTCLLCLFTIYKSAIGSNVLLRIRLGIVLEIATLT